MEVTLAHYLWVIKPQHKVMHMFWKFLRLQSILDALFDDDWCSLGLPETSEGMELAFSDLS